ncbi:hypothetical protein FXO37_32754 [Capsicum annuum]|nr:hypothetical protein FXO37_32754 [Capsicum annuum]
MTSQNDKNVRSNSDQENEFEQAIKKLEEMFSKMPDSEDHVIEKLSGELELDPTQIKIWLDNKRYHIQAQRDMDENEILRLENERLHAESLQLYSELNKRICANCNNAEQEQKILQDLQNENTRLTEEITRMSNMVAHFEEDPDDSDNDPNGIDLELRLECNDDPNGLDLELGLG